MKPSSRPVTNVALTPEECSVRFSDGTLLKVTDNGEISIKNAENSFIYEPSRLKRNQISLVAVSETSFGSKSISLREEVSLSIRVEKTERLRVEIFFSEKDEAGALVSGCFVTKEATSSNDWSVSFINTDRFLFNLSELVSVEATRAE